MHSCGTETPYFFCHGLNLGLMQDLSVGNRGISLYCNAVLLAVLYQFQRSVADVAQDLVNHRFDLSGLQQALNVSHLEIGNTDCFQLSGLISVLSALQAALLPST